MKPRRAHTVTVAAYDFWLRPGDVGWQWFCDCGELKSGFSTEEAAELAAVEHVEAHAPVETLR